MKKYLDLRISKTVTMVERWHGCPAILLEMRCSHKMLTIMIHGKKYECGKNLMIYCVDPIYICSPVSWSNSKIKIHSTELETGENGVLIKDYRANVEVISTTFEVAENVKF